jgi:DNA primase
MQGRLCFPIHNEDGELIAYSGRWVEDDLPKDTPRYKLPKGFEKGRVLFNLHRVLKQGVPETVVIVEGFWSALRLHSAGVPVVSSFGASLSEAQADLLKDAGVKNCILIFDGDGGGRAGVEQALPILAARLFVRTIILAEDVKPDTMDEALIDDLPKF